jgi:receptor protein-tyrosine kinase
MSKNFELWEQLKNNGWEKVAEYVPKPRPSSPEFSKPSLETRTHAGLNILVQRLFLSGARPLRRVVFTGTGPGVGCTSIAVHTAEVLSSQTGASVCLLDATANPYPLRKYLNLCDGPGLCDALTSRDPAHNFVRQVKSNLWVLTGNGEQSDLAPFRTRLQSCFLELQAQYDYVLVDSSPLHAGSDSLPLAVLTDGAVLVLKAGHSKRSSTRLAIAELEGAGVNVLGTVLNQRDYPIPEAIYKKI